MPAAQPLMHMRGSAAAGVASTAATAVKRWPYQQALQQCLLHDVHGPSTMVHMSKPRGLPLANMHGGCLMAGNHSLPPSASLEEAWTMKS